MVSIEEQLRFSAVKVNEGSGCIFQPDSEEYTYVLTVRHNLEEGNYKEKKLIPIDHVNIYRFNVEGDRLEVIDYHVHTDLDLALIIIKRESALPGFELSYAIPSRNEMAYIYGYPQRLSNNIHDKRDQVECRWTMECEDHRKYELKTVDPQHTWAHGSSQNLIGFSGSGMFFDNGESIILKGIFTELRDPTGANNSKSIAICIHNFETIAQKNNLKPLIPKSLLSFRPHVEFAFTRIDNTISHVFNANLKAVVEGPISPNMIVERINEALFVPSLGNFGNYLTNKRLWTSWLELLTFLNIHQSTIEFSYENYCEKVPLYFCKDENSIGRVIRLFLIDDKLRSRLKNGQLVIFSSTETSNSKEYLEKDKVKKIVVECSRPDSFSPKIMIGNASQVPEFSCVHIDHFSTEIGKLETDDLSLEEALELVKSTVIKIMSYAE